MMSLRVGHIRGAFAAVCTMIAPRNFFRVPEGDSERRAFVAEACATAGLSNIKGGGDTPVASHPVQRKLGLRFVRKPLND